MTARNHRTGGPGVSILLPTLNERAFLRDCLDSLVAQDYDDVVEILVLDGGSSDGTAELCEAVGGPIRVVRNHGVTAAAAMNAGIGEAKGDVIARADAHALYAPDYVRRCVEVLLETNADNVGGRMQPVGTTSFGRAVAAVTSSPLGVGPGRFHYGDRREEVDTVYLGCWWRGTLEQLGGFDDTRLQWGAEDHELNFRLRSQGGRVVLDPSIVSRYFPRESARQLARQYFNYGVGKASTLAKHRALPTWRPLAPAALVVATVTAAVFGRGWTRVAVPAAHAAACGVGALRLSNNPGVAPHRAFTALTICHWAYGAGFWAGMTRSVRGLAFDARPRGHR